MDTINIRRSIRKFNDKNVEEEKIEKLLRAGMQSPSAGNQQTWEFVVVHKQETKDKLSCMSPYAKPIIEAPLSIVLVENLENLRYPQNSSQDMGACAQNILLEAVEIGLGAVWLGVKPEEDRMKIVSETLELPKHIVPFAIIAVGYSDIKNEYIDRFNISKVHYEKYIGVNSDEILEKN